MASKNVWYFAYGSNMNPKVLSTRRGIYPMRSVKAVADSYKLTFDLPGLPYIEPSFANLAPLDHSSNHESKEVDEKMRLKSNFTISRPAEGVAHSITEEEFAQIQFSEGGFGYEGIGYQPIQLKLQLETGETIEAITLHGRNINPEFRPSHRYLNLIKDGANEFQLTKNYQQYLSSLPPYEIETQSQKLAKYMILIFALPIILPMFLTTAIWSMYFRKQPPYFLALIQIYFSKLLWKVHDHFLAKLFGKGC